MAGAGGGRPHGGQGHAAIVTAPALVAEEVTRFISGMASLSTAIDE
jgi:hypothetical protein